MSRAASPSAGRVLGRTFTMLGAFVLLATGGGLLTAAAALPAVQVAGGVVTTGEEVFDSLPDELVEPNLAQTSTFYYADGKTVMAHFYEQNRTEVPLSKISEWMQQAVVAVEDKRFYEHKGVDVQGLMRALVKNATSDGDQEGASTLTQQYVKNARVFAAEAKGDKKAMEEARATSYARKLEEAKIALKLEEQYSKNEILERYLNIAPFGPSQYGVEAAAQYYFSKPAAKLNLVESATLAGITQSPVYNNPETNPAKAEARRNDFLNAMYDQAMITKAQHDAAVAIPIASTLHITPLPAGCEVAGNSAYFCDYVTQVILTDKTFGKTEKARRNLLYRGGIDVVTTLDPAVEKKAQQALENAVPRRDPSGVANALASVQPGTGRILAMAQDRKYAVGGDLKSYETSVNYATDKAYGGSAGFQPGSTMKPFILADWLKENHSLRETFTVMTNYNQKMWKCDGALYPGENVPLKGASGSMTALNATINSSNTGYVTMIYDLDVCKVTSDVLEPLGVKAADGGQWKSYPSMVLGTNNVSPLTMAQAYATFAAGGEHCDPIAIDKMTMPSGKKHKVPSANCNKDTLEPKVATGVTYALTQALAVGTGRGRGIGRPAAAKTGTTDNNVHVWFAGFTPQMATVVWTGFPDKDRSLNYITINGHYTGEAFGAGLPGQVWHDFMLAAHENLPVEQFPQVDQLTLDGPKVAVPSVVGLYGQDAVDQLQAAGWTVNVDQTRRSFAGVPYNYVGSQSPGGGAMVSRGSTITLVISDGTSPIPTQDPTAQTQDGQGAQNSPDTGQGDTGNNGNNGNGNNGNNGRGNGGNDQ